MKTVILYYTETGKTLSYAKSIPSDALIDIVSLNEKRVSLPDEIERLGIITKTYNSSLPYPVREVLHNTLKERDNSAVQYVFALTVPGDATSFNGMIMENEIKECSLNLSYYKAVKRDDELNEIREDIEKEEILLPRFSLFLKTKMKISRKKNNPSLPPSSMKVKESCTLCRVCEMICPMNNIRIENSRVEIGDKCLSCLQCVRLCPERSITIDKSVEHIAPAVPLSELYRRP